MEEEGIVEAQVELRKLFSRYGGDLPYHQWPLESERWAELVLALLAQTVSWHDLDLRDVVDGMACAGLLEPTDLAAPADEKGFSKGIERVAAYLRETGVAEHEATRAARIVGAAASTLVLKYSGKVQRCLREHGKQVLDELAEVFEFGEMLPSGPKRTALILWLQNTLNLPLGLRTPAVEDYCRSRGFAYEELAEAADRIDLNLAVVDDLISIHEASERQAGG